MLPLIDYSALSHTRSRDVLWTQRLGGLKKGAQTGEHAVQTPLPLLETGITHSSRQSAQRATHLLPWFLAHLTDLPTHSRSADAFFRIGVKWRSGAVTTSCQRTADFHGMRRDSSQSAPSVTTSSWQVYCQVYCWICYIHECSSVTPNFVT